MAVKPVSTIGQAQQTSTFDGKPVCLEAKGRHDPCVLPRTVRPRPEGSALEPRERRAPAPPASHGVGPFCREQPPLVEGMCALVLIDAALLQRTRLGGSATTVCDGSDSSFPWEQSNGEAAGGGKKARRA